MKKPRLLVSPTNFAPDRCRGLLNLARRRFARTRINSKERKSVSERFQNAGCASCRVEAHASGSGCAMAASAPLHNHQPPPLLHGGARNVLGQARCHRPRPQRRQENAESRQRQGDTECALSERFGTG